MKEETTKNNTWEEELAIILGVHSKEYPGLTKVQIDLVTALFHKTLATERERSYNAGYSKRCDDTISDLKKLNRQADEIISLLKQIKQ